MLFDIESVWTQICKYQGEIFRQIRGREFSYLVKGAVVIPNTTNIQIPKKHFSEAIRHLPLFNTVPVQHLRGPSYIYAILMDKRISG